MPMIININRRRKKKSFTFTRKIDLPAEFTNLYYRSSGFYFIERTFNKSYHVMLSAWPPSVGKNSFRCFVGCQQTMLAPDCRGNSNCSVAMIYEPSGVMQSHQKASLNVQFWRSFKKDCCLHHFSWSLEKLTYD